MCCIDLPHHHTPNWEKVFHITLGYKLVTEAAISLTSYAARPPWTRDREHASSPRRPSSPATTWRRTPVAAPRTCTSQTRDLVTISWASPSTGKGELKRGGSPTCTRRRYEPPWRGLRRTRRWSRQTCAGQRAPRWRLPPPPPLPHGSRCRYRRRRRDPLWRPGIGIFFEFPTDVPSFRPSCRRGCKRRGARWSVRGVGQQDRQWRGASRGPMAAGRGRVVSGEQLPASDQNGGEEGGGKISVL